MRFVAPLALAAALSLTPGCSREQADGPPSIRLDDSVCVECNMIISDERWATATIIEGPRGPEALLFDDFNCQVNHETAHPDQTIHARWSHDYTTNQWLRTEDARFLISPRLRAPMGSQVAAFASIDNATLNSIDQTGRVESFEETWDYLRASQVDWNPVEAVPGAEGLAEGHDVP